MDYRYHKGVRTNNTVSSDHNDHSLHSLSFIQRISILRKTILRFVKRQFVPFGVVTTGLLFTTFKEAKASTVSDIILQRDGILTKVKKKVDPEGYDSSLWGEIGNFLSSATDWIKHLNENVVQMSVDLLTKIYELLMLVLQTPLFIFNNSYIKDTTLVFSGISILIVTILTMIQGIKRMFNKKHDNITKISKRYGLAVIGSGFAPFLFEKSFQLLNMVTKAITKIGSTEMNSENVVNHLKLSGFDTLALLGFDIVLIALMIPIFLQNGRRFFDLMCLAAITPLALSCWVFNDYKDLFRKWWYNVKKLGGTQLVYSIFICLMGIFIFGTRNIISGGGFFLKMLIVIGGLYRMTSPPSFIKSKVDQGDDVIDSGKGIYKSIKDIKNTITLKKLRKAIPIKKSKGAI